LIIHALKKRGPAATRPADKRCRETLALGAGSFASSWNSGHLRFLDRNWQFVNHIQLMMARQGAGFMQDRTVSGRPARCSANRNGCRGGRASASRQNVCS
jgi:hypothetical protein